MKRTYYNLNLNTELEQWWLAVEEADQVQVLKLHGSGVLEGLETTQNDPTSDMNVLIGAGYAWDGNGALLNPEEGETVDCSVDEDSVSTIPASGKERYIVIAVEADRDVNSGTVSNTNEDSYDYVVVSGEEANPGEAVAPELSDGRIHLAKVLLYESTTAITDAMIDTSDRPEIITVAKHMDDDEAHAAEAITYDNSTSGLTATDVQAAIDEMEERVDEVESGPWMKILTFTGDDNATQSITGAGGQPKYVRVYAKNTIVSGTAVQEAVKTDQDGTYAGVRRHYNDASYEHYDAWYYLENVIISLDADGFTIGNGNYINSSSNTFVAILMG